MRPSRLRRARPKTSEDVLTDSFPGLHGRGGCGGPGTGAVLTRHVPLRDVRVTQHGGVFLRNRSATECRCSPI